MAGSFVEERNRISLKMDACPTCGHRKDGDRPNGPLTDTRSLCELELATTIDKQQRIDLICAMTSLHVMASWNAFGKRDAAAKKIKYRRKFTEAEKIVRKVKQNAGRNKVRKPPVPGEFSLPDEVVAKIRAMDKPVVPEPEIEQNPQDALSSFFPKKLEEKTDATK